MPSSVERIGTPAPAASPSSFSFNRAFESLKSGSNTEQAGKIFQYAKLLTDQAKQALIGNLERVERCSKAFSERFLSDASLFRRASKVSQNFAENGEPMSRLEEAEIYTELMDPGSDDIRKALEASDPTRSFSNLVPLEKAEIASQKLANVKYVVDNQEDPGLRQELREALQTALSSAGGGSIDDPDAWKHLAANKAAMERFKQSSDVREIYKACMHEQDIDSAERSLEMIWRDEDGEVRPVMHIQRYAKNPENGYVSQMGFDIEKMEGKRVIKNVVVETDADSRGKNQGPEFLFNLLPLIKAYKLSEAEFEANIKIGSYVWTKIADIDVGAMRQYLPEHAQDELKEAAEDTKRQKSIIMKDFILPQFEQNMERAFASLVAGTDAQTAETVAKLRTEYQALRQKALSGDATMEDLATLGKESDLFRFDKEGEIVDPQSPDAALRGHLGKAAIMGIPWKARVPLDRAGLFRIIDKLHKGTGLMASLKRTGMKFGLLLSA